MALAPDVILATGNATVGPLHQATHTVPIVFMLGSLVRVRLHRRLNKIKCGSGFRRASEAGVGLAGAFCLGDDRFGSVCSSSSLILFSSTLVADATTEPAD
jgi:hypothetical protein